MAAISFSISVWTTSVVAAEGGKILVEFVVSPARGSGELTAAVAEAAMKAMLATCPYTLTGPAPANMVLTALCVTYHSNVIPMGE